MACVIGLFFASCLVTQKLLRDLVVAVIFAGA